MATDSDSYDMKLDRALVKYHQRQSAAVAPEDCPSAEDLLDYVDGKLASESVASVHEHLPYCAACRDLILSFRPSPAESSSQHPATLRHNADRPLAWPWTAWIRRRWVPASALAFAAMLAVVELNLYPSKVSMLAHVDPSDSVSAARSATGEVDPMAAAYERGIAALIDAQTWVLNRVDERKVDESIRYLKEAKRLAETGNNQTYVGECAFHLGKAYLKKQNLNQARQSFEEVLRLDDPSETLLLTKRRAEQCLKAIGR